MLSRLLVVAILSAVTATAALAQDASRYGTWGVDLAGMDRSVKPGDDFFRYVNGKWVETTQIPPDRTSYSSFSILSELNDKRVRGILDRWAADKQLRPGSDEAKVAMLYRTFLDEATVEKLDAKPLQPYLDAVRKATTHTDVARLMGRSRSTFGSSIAGAFVGDDAKNPGSA